MDNLDYPLASFEKILNQSTELVIRQHQKINEIKGFYNYPQQEVESWFDEELPQNGMDVEQLLNFVEDKVLNTATGNLGKNMYGYVVSGGNQMSLVADKLASTVNQNVAKWHLAPSMVEIEKRVLKWTSKMVGFGGDAGLLVSSGSAANFDGLTIARNVFFEKHQIIQKGMFGMKPFRVYCSSETHSCVDKSVQMLGIGTDNLIKIAINENYTINLTALRKQIENDIENGFLPFCIVGNAGTVNTGAIDDFNALADLAEEYQMWFHIDGAYGGLIAALDSKKSLYAGIDRANSVALDFHKWLYQPFEAGCVLVKNWEQMRKAYYKKASYLLSDENTKEKRTEFNEHHFLLSRNAKAFKVWFSIKCYGMEAIKSMMQKDIDLTDYLSELIRQSDDFKLVADSNLAVSCFQYIKKGNENVEAFHLKLVKALEKDGRIFITGTYIKGEFVLRACLINHRKDKASTEYLLEVIREVAEGI